MQPIVLHIQTVLETIFDRKPIIFCAYSC